MGISVNTNMTSLLVQQSLNKATSGMATAMERMSTGLRINSSKDDAAGMAVSSKLDYKISSLTVAQENGQMGASLLDTTEGVLSQINKHLVRIRDLTEQAANGTYGSDALKAISTEVKARLDEVTRVATSTEFNGMKLLDGNGVKADINLQVGIDKEDYSIIKLSKDLFKSATTSTLFGEAVNVSTVYKTDSSAREFLTKVDKAMEEVTNRKTEIGGNQQRIISAIETANVMATNLTSANSLIKDADIAKESSNYIKEQILQQTAATLLASANQAPSIALNLV